MSVKAKIGTDNPKCEECMLSPVTKFNISRRNNCHSYNTDIYMDSR